MEPVTHMLAGACLARSGLNRRAAYATLTMVVAAELPDIDTLWSLRGPVAGFEHHREITHTFLGLPFEAAFLVVLVYGLHRWRMSRAERLERAYASDGTGHAAGAGRSPRPLTATPVRWGWLYGLALLALLSHLLLDYTNNYGLRPFYPFDSHWYAASISFIFDPMMFAMLLTGLVAPALFGLVSSEVGVRKQAFRGRGWAIAALIGVVAWWGLRDVEHAQAVNLAMDQSIARPGSGLGGATPASGAPQPEMQAGLQSGAQQPGSPAASAPPVTYLGAQRVLANAHPLSPFAWSTVTDFGPVYQLAEVETTDATVRPAEALVPKPKRSAAILAAEASPLGRFYMNWSPMPFVSVTLLSPATAPPDEAGWTVVIFRDPRFMGQIPLLHEDGNSPLTASVTLDASDRVVRESMGARMAQ